MHFLVRESWRSFGAGIAISYVFLDILPHLASKQYALQNTVGPIFGTYLAHHAYLLALFGFVLFFGLTGVAEASRISQPAVHGKSEPHPVVYLLMMAIATYSFLIGYLIGEQPDHRYEPVIIFAIAMAIHMTGVDHTLRNNYSRVYDQRFRYILAAATFARWLLGTLTVVPDVAFALVFALVVGIIMIVAFMFELPVVAGGRQFWLFVAGVISFSAILLTYEALAVVNLGS